MGLGQQVESDLKTAMKSREELTVSCLRLVRAALKNKEKDLRRELNQEEEIQVVKGLAKQRRDSIEQFTKGGRNDLAEKEQAELAMIEKYLPAQMDETAISAVVDRVFSDLAPQGPKDMGRVMKETMARLQGQADGKLVNQLVRQKLEQNKG